MSESVKKDDNETIEPDGSGGESVEKHGKLENSREINKPKVPAIKELLPSVPMESSGSATGNPRNKVALRPGHSLMDWVRLGNSGRDLTGVGGVIKEVSLSELSKHNKTEDAWIAVKGRVYNVTHYLDFHPGGVPELMRGVGKDATTLFNQIHAWVNHEQILQKCLVGPLRGGLLFSATEPSKSQPLTQRLFGKKPAIATVPELPAPAVVPVARSPRLDWFQQLSSLTIVLYAGMVPRGPGRVSPWVQTCLDERGTSVSLHVTNVNGTSGAQYIARLDLHAPVRWPPLALRTHPDSGKVEVIFTKESEELWPRYGQPADGHGETISADSGANVGGVWWPASVQESTEVTHNTKLVNLQLEGRVAFTLPVGSHLRVRITGSDVSRSYTPVGPSLCGVLSASSDHVILMVKSYKDGIVSSKLCGIEPSPERVLELSDPIVTFDARRVTNAACLYVAAAGTGITPMLRVVSLALQDSRRACKKLHLMFFNRTEADIIWRDQFDKLSSEDDRFQITHVLSDLAPEWTGLTGHINCTLLETLLGLESKALASTLQPSPALVCVCGPDAFTENTKSLLQEMGLPDDQLHCFLG